GTQIIAFLQPILIPFAVAGVLAYLLEPLVNRLVRWGIKRQQSVLLVFSVATVLFVGVLLLIVPTLVRQGGEFAKEVPAYVDKARGQTSAWVNEWHAKLKKDYNIEILEYLGATPKKEEDPTIPPPAPAPSPQTPAVPPDPSAIMAIDEDNFDLNTLLSGDWIKKVMTNIVPTTWGVVKRSLGGFMGMFGFLLSLVIVPLYLYYFLTESKTIASRWSDYVPLRASRFKDEVVGTITEINRYLIAFFRGQLVVSLINGVATGLGLVIVGLKFGWLIGLSLCVLGMIPYLGIVVCMIPAVIIASVQGGSYLIPGSWPSWAFPVIVLAIFLIVQQIDGLFITPKIVGESVGLHPMTVIMSVFLWSLVMGGLLGAILAVPMTASIKVLFQRYIWHKRFRSQDELLVVEP
ncbi:MAG: family transporter, partial [Verrucomicrobiaceae bacterium]|nr:family transporter [Verrucomicrobiaceae bacterium]